jgi:Ca2+-binding EF-hand superfamily protein
LSLTLFAPILSLPGQAADNDAVVSEFIDGNKDHQISYDEFVHSLAIKAMHDIDKNKDGVIDFDEATEAHHNKNQDALNFNFPNTDNNANGNIDLNELEQTIKNDSKVKENYIHLDHNDDGLLDQSELTHTKPLSIIDLKF